MLLVKIFDGDTDELVCTDTLESFLQANADTPEVGEAVLALKPGESTAIGGGAAARFRVQLLDTTADR